MLEPRGALGATLPREVSSPIPGVAGAHAPQRGGAARLYDSDLPTLIKTFAGRIPSVIEFCWKGEPVS